MILEYIFYREPLKKDIIDYLKHVLHPEIIYLPVKEMIQDQRKLAPTCKLNRKYLSENFTYHVNGKLNQYSSEYFKIAEGADQDKFQTWVDEVFKIYVGSILKEFESKELVRNVHSRYSLTFLGEVTIETQVPLFAATSFIHFFENSLEPTSKACLDEVTEMATFIDTDNEPPNVKPEKLDTFRELRTLMRDYTQDKKKNSKLMNHTLRIYRGDVESSRRTNIWLAFSLYKFYVSYLFHLKAKESEQYYQVPKKEIINSDKVEVSGKVIDQKNTLRRIKEVAKRFNDKKERLHVFVENKPHVAFIEESQYRDIILEELKNRGKDGALVRELKQLLSKKFEGVTGGGIRNQLLVLLDEKKVRRVEESEPGKLGRKKFRYFVLGKKPKREIIYYCEECHGFNAYKSWCRYRQRSVDAGKKACKKFEPISRNHRPFRKFKVDERGNILCPHCQEPDTLLKPTHYKMSICNKCGALVARHTKGRFIFYISAVMPEDRIKRHGKYVVVNRYQQKQLIFLSEGKRLKLIKDETSNFHEIKVIDENSGRTTSYLSEEVYRVELAGGDAGFDDLYFIESLGIKIILHGAYKQARAREQKTKESNLRMAIEQARIDGRLFPVAVEMAEGKLKSNIYYTLKLKRLDLDILVTKKKVGFVDWVNSLVFQLLNHAVRINFLREEFFRNSETSMEVKFDTAIKKLRSIEGNSEKLAWDGIKVCLPKPFKFSKRQEQRHEQTVLHSKSVALDRYNVGLNYAYFNLERFACPTLTAGEFSQFWPGRGILHYRAINGEKSIPIESSENRELVYDFIDAYRIPFRYYLMMMFRNDKMRILDFNWGNDEWRRRVFTLAKDGEKKLGIVKKDELLWVRDKKSKKLYLIPLKPDNFTYRLLSFPFFSDHQVKPLSQIMGEEATKLANYLLHDQKYKAFSAFEERSTAQQVNFFFEVIKASLTIGEGEDIKIVRDKEIIVKLEKRYGLKKAEHKEDFLGHVIKLDLTDRNLRSIPIEVSDLKHLQWLNLSSNKIEKIEGLENLVQLQVLDLFQNRISKIEGLDELSNLEQLNLQFNQIRKMENLEHLTNLKMLNLFENQIEKIECVENLASVTILNLSGNKIEKIEGLERLPQLRELDLANNPLFKDDKEVYDRGLDVVIEFCKRQK